MNLDIIFNERVHQIQFFGNFIKIDGLPYILPPDVDSIRGAMELALREIQYNPKHRQGAK